MKIINKDTAYVQKNDIAFLNSTDLPIPASVYLKVYSNNITIIDESNRYDFVKFDEQSEIEYFKGLDWIVDYGEVKDLSEDDIIKLANSIIEEREKIATSFNTMAEKEKEKHTDMITKCDLLEYKYYSLRDILWFKQGHIAMNIPKDDNKNNKRKSKVV